MVAQMIESEYEELEWQLAVERARAAAEAVPARVTGAAPPPPRFRWSSYPARVAAAKR